MSGEKIEVTFEINSDMDKLLDKIVDDYNLPDKSKAIRVLLDYVEEKETEWDDMFATIRCNRCWINVHLSIKGSFKKSYPFNSIHWPVS